MSRVPRNLLSFWRTRLLELKARKEGGHSCWRDRIEYRVIVFFLKRHNPDGGGDAPVSARPLEHEDAEKASRLNLSPLAAERLDLPISGQKPHPERGFRSEDELQGLEAEERRRLNYRRYLARRASLLILFFLLLVLWFVSMLIILRFRG